MVNHRAKHARKLNGVIQSSVEKTAVNLSRRAKRNPKFSQKLNQSPVDYTPAIWTTRQRWTHRRHLLAYRLNCQLVKNWSSYESNGCGGTYWW